MINRYNLYRNYTIYHLIRHVYLNPYHTSDIYGYLYVIFYLVSESILCYLVVSDNLLIHS